MTRRALGGSRCCNATARESEIFFFLSFLLSFPSFLSFLLSFFKRVCFSFDGFNVIELIRPSACQLYLSRVYISQKWLVVLTPMNERYWIFFNIFITFDNLSQLSFYIFEQLQISKFLCLSVNSVLNTMSHTMSHKKWLSSCMQIKRTKLIKSWVSILYILTVLNDVGIVAQLFAVQNVYNNNDNYH